MFAFKKNLSQGAKILLNNHNFMSKQNFNFQKFNFMNFMTLLRLKNNFWTPAKNNCLINYQKFYMRSLKTKRRAKYPNSKHKQTNHTGMMKRVRVVGPIWDRGFKFWPTGNVHKMTNKSSANLKRKRKARYICKADLKRVKRLIPYYKRQKYKN